MKKRIPIHKLHPGFKIRLAGGKTMTVTGQPVKQRDGTYAIPNDFNGVTYGDAHLTFRHEHPAPPQEKPAQP